MMLITSMMLFCLQSTNEFVVAGGSGGGTMVVAQNIDKCQFVATPCIDDGVCNDPCIAKGFNKGAFCNKGRCCCLQ